MNEIEKYLFIISKQDRQLFIDRILYHVFRYNMWIIELFEENNEIEDIINAIEEEELNKQFF
jgi:hypothetical protein